MIDTIETLCSYSYLFLSAFGFLKFVFYKNKNLWPSILLALYFIMNIATGLFLVGVFEAFYLRNLYNLLFNGIFLSIIFIYISIIISLYIDELSIKKIKTLIRIPIIGFLIGYALSFSLMVWVFIALEILTLLFLVKKRSENRYLYRSQLRSIACLIFLFFADTNESIFISLYCLFALLLKAPIINAFIVKGLIMKYDKAHD
jgi:hypothetical protein